MKDSNRFKEIAVLGLLLMASSCTSHSGESYLANRMYVNEETLDKIEFTRERRAIFTWASDMCNYWDKDQSYEFYYSVDNNENIWVSHGTSGGGFNFPYRTLKFSDSKEEIFFTEKRSDKSGVFKRVKYHAPQVSLNRINTSSGEVVALVRSVVLEKGQELSEKEKKIILRSVPKTAQYQMAGTFGQYIWIWNLPTGRMIEVKYVGDLKSPIDTEKITVLFSNK